MLGAGELTCKPGMRLVAGLAKETDPKGEIAPFCIDEHEFTPEEEGTLLSAAPGAEWQLLEGNLAGPRKPLVNRSFDEARAICKARGMDLPTDEQWGKAARGPDGKPYGTKSGELEKDEACYDRDGPCDVMSFPPNGYGLYDMTGGVWEWTLGVVDGIYGSCRGGSWSDIYPWRLRAGYGGLLSLPDVRYALVGLRCVASPQGSGE